MDAADGPLLPLQSISVRYVIPVWSGYKADNFIQVTHNRKLARIRHKVFLSNTPLFIVNWCMIYVLICVCVYCTVPIRMYKTGLFSWSCLCWKYVILHLPHVAANTTSGYYDPQTWILYDETTHNWILNVNITTRWSIMHYKTGTGYISKAVKWVSWNMHDYHKRNKQPCKQRAVPLQNDQSF